MSKKTFAEELAAAREALAASADAVQLERGATLQALADAEALRGQLSAAVAELEALKASSAAALTAAADDLTKAHAELAGAVKRAEAAEGKLALVPAVADITAGVKPVADGGQAGAEMDWIAESEKRSGAERIVFYRANRQNIDAAYAARAAGKR